MHVRSRKDNLQVTRQLNIREETASFPFVVFRSCSTTSLASHQLLFDDDDDDDDDEQLLMLLLLLLLLLLVLGRGARTMPCAAAT